MSTSPIPTTARIHEEQQALFLFPVNIQRLSAFIPFKREWLQMAQAAESVQCTAAAIVHRSDDVNEASAIANWLKQVAHEIEALVLQEQLRRTRILADEQTRQMKCRKHAKRLEEDANIMAAIEALEALIDGRGL